MLVKNDSSNSRYFALRFLWILFQSNKWVFFLGHWLKQRSIYRCDRFLWIIFQSINWVFSRQLTQTKIEISFYPFLGIPLHSIISDLFLGTDSNQNRYIVVTVFWKLYFKAIIVTCSRELTQTKVIYIALTTFWKSHSKH